MQSYQDEVLSFASELEGQVKTSSIASLTKKHFSNKCSKDTVATILKDHTEYFDQSKVRKPAKKISLKTRAINLIKYLNEDDPKLESVIQELSEPFRIVK